MPVTDLKVSLRKRGVTNFETDGYRMLPITTKEYVLGLLGPDGKINPNLIPAWLYASRQPAGVADLLAEAQGGTDIADIFVDQYAFGLTLPYTDVTAQGIFVEVTTSGQLKNASVHASKFELVGSGNAGDRTFPLNLETGDYIVLVKISTSPELYSIAIVDNTYGDATTVNKGIVKLYAGVDSSSDILAATASAVKTAYDLANSKEEAFAKNTAFNKNFAGTGIATTVARSDHYHSTFDYSEADLAGNIIKGITITDGIVTALTTQSIAGIASGAGLATLTDLDYYVLGTDFNNYVSDAESDRNTIRSLAKKGLEYYSTVALADQNGHAEGDIVAVLEA